MKKLIIIIMLVAAGAFAWWTISPLFITVEVQDELDPAIAALLESQATSNDTAKDSVVPIPESDRQPVLIESSDNAETQALAIVSGPAPSAPAETSAPVDEPTTVVSPAFPIADTRGHPASGSIRTIISPDQTLVRYENYSGTNGPDLYVYLAKDLDADEFVDLGRAKGNMGNINYTVPNDVDLDEYKYVMTWCRAFGVLFDYAEIN